MQLVDNVKDLKTIGEPTVYHIKLDEILTIEGEFPFNTLVELDEINVDGKESIFFTSPRRFIPAPNSATADNESILMYTNKESEDGKGTVLVKGHLIKDNGTIRINGEGFLSVKVSVWNYVSELDDPADETEDNSGEDLGK